MVGDLQLIFLGAPGSGKGTQASHLVESRGYRHVSTGELLRNEIASASELGKRVKGILDAGNLVDDRMVLELLQGNCDVRAGNYIFDGFPRTLQQAKLLDEVLLVGVRSLAIHFEVDLDQLVDRLVNRRTCAGCGAIYNLLTCAPRRQGECDHCGGTDLEQRKDDRRETVENRLKVFKSTMGPVLDYYREGRRLEKIDASRSFDSVQKKLEEVVGV